MKFLLFSLSALAASATPTSKRAAAPAFILAGDSTTAVQSSGGGGWGNGFLSFLRAGAWGVNLGHNGATTVSFVSGGDWKTVLSDVDSRKAAGYDPYVTIQFGHNDQKADKGISLDQYQTNLQNLAKDVTSHGGTPVLVTPLTRRSFSSAHSVSDSLKDQRTRTIAAANAVGAAYLDLNQASIAYVNAIGDVAAHKYNLKSDDNTHLNAWGSVVFGRMLADLLLEKKSALGTYITPNATLSQQIKNGVAA